MVYLYLVAVAALVVLAGSALWHVIKSPRKIHVTEHQFIPNTRCIKCGLIVNRYDERHVCANCVAEGK